MTSESATTPAVCYRDAPHPCAVCGEPSDALWHRSRGPMDPHAPGVCQACATRAVLAFLADLAGASRRRRGA